MARLYPIETFQVKRILERVVTFQTGTLTHPGRLRVAQEMDQHTVPPLKGGYDN